MVEAVAAPAAAPAAGESVLEYHDDLQAYRLEPLV